MHALEQKPNQDNHAFFSMRVKKKIFFKHIIIGPNVLHRIEYGGVYIRVSKDVVDHDDFLCIKNQFKTSQEDFKKPETNRNVLFLNRKLKIL